MGGLNGGAEWLDRREDNGVLKMALGRLCIKTVNAEARALKAVQQPLQ